MFGMAGGSGQVLSDRRSQRGPVERVLDRDGHRRSGHQRLLVLLLPRQEKKRGGMMAERARRRDEDGVFLNPQSILCGMIAGLLFIPTTIFDMVWGVRYLQEARGLDCRIRRDAFLDGAAGLIIGCPLLGFISDRLAAQAGDRRRGGSASPAWRGFCTAPWTSFPLYPRSLGLASGAAMLPYTVIKEANPPGMSGTATGVVNFLNFTFSALLGPVFGWLLVTVSGGATQMTLDHYQMAFQPSSTAWRWRSFSPPPQGDGERAARTAPIPFAQREAI